MLGLGRDQLAPRVLCAQRANRQMLKPPCRIDALPARSLIVTGITGAVSWESFCDEATPNTIQLDKSPRGSPPSGRLREISSLDNPSRLACANMTCGIAATDFEAEDLPLATGVLSVATAVPIKQLNTNATIANARNNHSIFNGPIKRRGRFEQGLNNRSGLRRANALCQVELEKYTQQVGRASLASWGPLNRAQDFAKRPANPKCHRSLHSENFTAIPFVNCPDALVAHHAIECANAIAPADLLAFVITAPMITNGSLVEPRRAVEPVSRSVQFQFEAILF